MFIVTKDGKALINTTNLATIQLSENGKVIAGFNLKYTHSAPFGEYDTEQEATDVFNALCRAIGRNDRLFRMDKKYVESENMVEEYVFGKRAL